MPLKKLLSLPFARSQLDYALGAATGRSFVVGYWSVSSSRVAASC
ncbi:MAG: glycoside hydrolase family 9 protein [Taibaiella sp.]|nr:glycoside hydrolase family 9 protein [Taibaiella sp.]